MNSVQLIGRLTRDPEVRYTTGQNQTAVARFAVAVNDGYGENERTSYINVVVFGRAAENCEKYLAKGRQVGITGRIQTGSYEKDGRTIYTTDVVASRVEFLGGGEAAAKNENSSAEEPAQQQMDEAPSGFQQLDDDIPF